MIPSTRKRPLTWFLLLVVVNLFLLSAQVRNQEGRLLIRSWSLALLSPPALALQHLCGEIKGLFDHYAFLLHAETENQRLQAENARLEIELNQLRSLVSIQSRRQDYELFQRRFVFDTVAAAVIGRSAPFYSTRLVINVGTRQGIRKDSPILTPRGIVGRIVAATRASSEVELITNDRAGAGALLEGSRSQGVIQGDGTALLRLDYIPNSESVEPGQVVYTAGTDGIYPKGLPIGTVVGTERGLLRYRSIRVRPFVDFARLEETLAVTDPPGPFLYGQVRSDQFLLRPRTEALPLKGKPD
ncbi:MAG: rod shape-determining protein MreC [Acidobacteriota bacterium]